MKFFSKSIHSSTIGFFIFIVVFFVCLPNSTGTKITKNDNNELLSPNVPQGNQLLNRSKRSRFYMNPTYGAELTEADNDDVYDRDIEENSEDNVKYAIANRVFKSKSGNTKITTERYDDELESKTEDEIPDQLAVETRAVNDTAVESRACAACASGVCANPNTVISGLPIIQILGAMFAGVILAAIFIVLYINFIDSEKKTSGGYGYAAAQPQMQYGAPSSQYGTNGYSNNHNRYGRSFGSFDFNQLSSLVWKALEKFSDTSLLSTKVVKE